MAEQLSTIVELQEALDELEEARRLLDGIPDWMQELHEEHSTQKAVIESLEAEVEEAAQARRAAETEISDLRAKVKHFQEQISLVRNQREYGALLQEIDTAKQRITEFEEQAIGAMERHEEAGNRLREQQESFKELDERYAAELEKWEAQKPSVNQKATELGKRIEVLRERLPRGTLSQFERIRTRHHGQAVAPIVETDRGGRMQKIWSCGACNYRVRPQIVVAIHTKGSIQHCDSCKRILFIAEDPN